MGKVFDCSGTTLLPNDKEERNIIIKYSLCQPPHSWGLLFVGGWVDSANLKD